MLPLVAKKLKGQAHGQGMGLHTEAEVIEMSIKDLRAISNFLGKLNFCFHRLYSFPYIFISFKGTKQFLMGDKAIEADCAVFGILSQLLWNCPGSPFEQLLNGNTCPNLISNYKYIKYSHYR